MTGKKIETVVAVKFSWILRFRIFGNIIYPLGMNILYMTEKCYM
jgi:hypothetical protein